MKSRLFESINDRQNIIDAYSKMAVVSESTEDIERLSAPEGMKYPICVEDETEGPKWVGLEEILEEFGDLNGGAEEGSDEFYFNTAYEYIGEEELYKKLLEECGTDLTPSAEEIARAGGVYSKKEIYDYIVEFGKQYVETLHENDIEVDVPDWAMTYLVNNDATALNDGEKEMIDKWEDEYVQNGYEFVPGFENIGFKPYPAFGLASDCCRCWFRKRDEKNESCCSDSISNKDIKKMLKKNPDMKMICDAEDFIGNLDDEGEDEVIVDEKELAEIRKYYSEKGYLDPEEDKDKIELVIEAGFTVKTAPNGDMKFVIEWEK